MGFRGHTSRLKGDMCRDYLGGVIGCYVGEWKRKRKLLFNCFGSRDYGYSPLVMGNQMEQKIEHGMETGEL